MSNTFMDALEAQYNYKFTENGAIAHKTSGSKVYDMFAFGGAYRSRNEADCMNLFKNAFEEDADLGTLVAVDDTGACAADSKTLVGTICFNRAVGVYGIQLHHTFTVAVLDVERYRQHHAELTARD